MTTLDAPRHAMSSPAITAQRVPAASDDCGYLVCASDKGASSTTAGVLLGATAGLPLGMAAAFASAIPLSRWPGAGTACIAVGLATFAGVTALGWKIGSMIEHGGAG